MRLFLQLVIVECLLVSCNVTENESEKLYNLTQILSELPNIPLESTNSLGNGTCLTKMTFSHLFTMDNGGNLDGIKSNRLKNSDFFIESISSLVNLASYLVGSHDMDPKIGFEVVMYSFNFGWTEYFIENSDGKVQKYPKAECNDFEIHESGEPSQKKEKINEREEIAHQNRQSISEELSLRKELKLWAIHSLQQVFEAFHARKKRKAKSNGTAIHNQNNSNGTLTEIRKLQTAYNKHLNTYKMDGSIQQTKTLKSFLYQAINFPLQLAVRSTTIYSASVDKELSNNNCNVNLNEEQAFCTLKRTKSLNLSHNEIVKILHSYWSHCVFFEESTCVVLLFERFTEFYGMLVELGFDGTKAIELYANEYRIMRALLEKAPTERRNKIEEKRFKMQKIYAAFADKHFYLVNKPVSK